MAYFDYYTRHLELPGPVLESILSRSLVYKGSLYPVASVFRLRKFLNRGWRISFDQIMKMLFQISSINLTDPNVLKEQLTGVDTSYMASFIYKATQDDKQLDTDMLVQLLEDMYGDG